MPRDPSDFHASQAAERYYKGMRSTRMVMTFATYEEAVHFYAGLLRDMPLDKMTTSLAAYMLDEKQTMNDESGRFIVIENAA
jgi:hypothetical protein